MWASTGACCRCAEHRPRHLQRKGLEVLASQGEANTAEHARQACPTPMSRAWPSGICDSWQAHLASRFRVNALCLQLCNQLQLEVRQGLLGCDTL